MKLSYDGMRLIRQERLCDYLIRDGNIVEMYLVHIFFIVQPWFTLNNCYFTRLLLLGNFSDIVNEQVDFRF